MKRRSAIKNAALLMGYGVSATAIAGMLNGCKSDIDVSTATEWQPALFDTEELNLMEVVTEHILPATDTPGANDVFVHRFIDKLLEEVHTAETQERFKKGLADLMADCQTNYKKTFAECSEQERNESLLRFKKQADEQWPEVTKVNDAEEKEFWRAAAEDKSIGRNYQGTYRQPFFTMLKNMTLMGYFTSEKIGEEVLNYDPIPGKYDPCIDLPENGRRWSLG